MKTEKTCWHLIVGLAALLVTTGAFAQDDDFDEDAFDEDAFDEDEAADDTEPEEDIEDVDDVEDEGDEENAPVSIDAPAPSGGTPGEGLLLTQGTMQFGGAITLSIEAQKTRIFNPNDPTESKMVWNSGANLGLAPMAGYFVIDNLELLLDVGFVMGFGDLYGDDKTFFFDVGARYILDFGVVCLYAGALFGMDFLFTQIEITNPANPAQTAMVDETFSSIVLSVPIGLLIPFNRHVALDVGTRIIFDIGIGDNDITQLSIPIGYFGVQGFFNLFN